MGFSSVAGVAAPQPDYLWDFTALTGLAIDDPIAAISSSGAASSLTATAAGAARPLFKGTDGALFNGVDQRMVIDPFVATSGRSVVYLAVVARSNLTGFANLFAGAVGVSEAASNGYVTLVPHSRSWLLGIGNGVDGTNFELGSTGDNNTGWLTAIGVKAGGNVSLRVNGVNQKTVADLLPTANQSTTLYLGGGFTGDSYDGYVRRVAIWLPSRAFTFAELAAIDDFLN